MSHETAAVRSGFTTGVTMQSEWRHVKDGDVSKIYMRWTLSGQVAEKRDHAIMGYMRNLCEAGGGGSLVVNPVALTELWDNAWVAGRDSHSPDPVGGLANSGAAEAAKKKRTRKKAAAKGK